MYRFTFERRIPLEGGTFVSEFDVVAANLGEAGYKAVQQIDENLPSWLLQEDCVCLLGNLVRGVKIDASYQNQAVSASDSGI
jgi:hypothetical protein